MNRLPIVLVTFLLIFVSFIGCKNGETTEWKLVWSDEFNYQGLPNPSKWNYDTIGNAYGWGNNELQFYKASREANVWVNGKYLHINAIKEEVQGFNYTSARLTTKEKGDWLYGKVEVRAKVPDGVGLWSAIWMFPTDSEYGIWPRSGNIDIMEYVGYNPDSIFSTIHTGAFNHGINTQIGTGKYLADCKNEFHIYAIEWFESHIDFFVDGEKYFTFNNSLNNTGEWPFDKRFHLIMNLAVGGNWGGKMGVDDAVFPKSMVVDYVRVYKSRVQ
jgi:beta-glucanase (GH16 family)